MTALRKGPPGCSTYREAVCFSPEPEPGFTVMNPVAPSGLAGLAERIRSGDAAADEELVRRFHERVFVMALARTRDRETARDVAQETMLAVLTSVREGRIHEPEKLAGYVCGTARNLVLEHLRARRNRADPLLVDPPSAVDVEEELEESERRTLVRRVLRALGASDRLVLLLTLVDGLTPAQAGARMGIRPDAVRQRKLRALRRARAMLERLSRPSSGRHLPLKGT